MIYVPKKYRSLFPCNPNQSLLYHIQNRLIEFALTVSVLMKTIYFIHLLAGQNIMHQIIGRCHFEFPLKGIFLLQKKLLLFSVPRLLATKQNIHLHYSLLIANRQTIFMLTANFCVEISPKRNVAFKSVCPCWQVLQKHLVLNL